MNLSYKELPLIDFSAQKVTSNRERKNTGKTPHDYALDRADAMSVLHCANLPNDQYLENAIQASEKHMIKTQLQQNNTPQNTIPINANNNRPTDRKIPHYTHLIELKGHLIFQAACCLQLKIFAASLDGKSVSGKTLFNSHSDSGGGKLVYEFLGTGKELIVDLKRGESANAQRLIFQI